VTSISSKPARSKPGQPKPDRSIQSRARKKGGKKPVIDRVGAYQGEIDLDNLDQTDTDRTDADQSGATTLVELSVRRTRLKLEGMVQGVGFRPFVNRLAQQLELAGWVANSGDGVTVDIEGDDVAVEDFLRRLGVQLPPLARIDRLHTEELAPAGYNSFAIRESVDTSTSTVSVLPDVATCGDCLNEITNPVDRRYRYPFTNCTNCGPRFSILETLPYDRANTTMRHFDMCAACRTEYETPADRRFHAQPNACPDCGPQLSLLDAGGNTLAQRDAALLAAANALRDGKIVALKGLGGFQLLVDAHNGDAVARLRQRKQRPHKPFAVMAPRFAFAETACYVSELERELLTSPQAPIVLLRRRAHPDWPHARKTVTAIADAVAPANPLLGVMLPYTPLHHLLLPEFGFPVVATSGNLSGEPMVTDNDDALDRLRGIADVFLVHDRPIACALDDSVVRVIAGRAMMLRRARSYAPLPIVMHGKVPPLLALGGHLKSAIATTAGSQVMVGPHIGDLDTAPARKAFHQVLDRLRALHPMQAVAIACDRHPDYYTTSVARKFDTKVIPVQHHVAHIAACMADNAIDGPVLGVAWDGTGYGDDGTIWGGEFITLNGVSTHRVAHLRPFPLPGGEKAVTEPRRAALGVLFDLFGAELFGEKMLEDLALADTTLEPLRDFSATERKVLTRMLVRNLNSPRTSSIGRLFDAVASLTGLVQRSSFEGQAAMALEFALGQHPPQVKYDIDLITGDNDAQSALILDWRPMLRALLADIEQGVSTAHMAAAFHNALVEALVAVAQRVGETRVVLTGGCFQNRYLTERAIDRLRTAGFEPFWHQHVPPNDGGLALGQAAWATRLLEAGVA
jgi:hydrogenase maturation protein HypF